MASSSRGQLGIVLSASVDQLRGGRMDLNRQPSGSAPIWSVPWLRGALSLRLHRAQLRQIVVCVAHRPARTTNFGRGRLRS